MKKILASLSGVIAAAVMVAAPLASAVASTTNITVTPTSTGYDSNNTLGVANDSAPGFTTGSIASDGTGKTDLYLTPQVLFGKDVTLGDIDTISYWTKKSTTHTENVADWFLNIYTKPYAGDVSTPSWYGDRIGTEPYFAVNLNDPVNTWNNWTTDGTTNQLRFFESTAGAPGSNFGSYTDPTWDTFVSGNALSSQAYAGHQVLFFSPQTGSATADGFTGQIDGLSIKLNDGSVANVNFENKLAAPTITSPANNAVVTSAQLDKIDWTDVLSASPVTYEYRAYSDPTYTSSIYSSGSLTDSQILTPGTPEGTYYVQVRATDNLGNVSDWSNDSTNPYKIVVNNTPSPVVNQPTSKDDCKKGSFGNFTDANGNKFPNQGQCVAYVASKGKVVGNFAQLQF